MKKKSILRLCTTAWFFACVTVHAASFQLKGVTLGSSPAVACGSSKVTDNFGVLFRKHKADAPSLIEMGTTECEVEYASFGGNKLAGPAKLLFLDDSLILIKLELSSLPLASVVDIRKALLGDYQKPKRSVSRPFVTDTWRQHGETLIFERLGREWDDNDVTIILRQDSGYRTYEIRSKANSLELEKLEGRKTKKDIR